MLQEDPELAVKYMVHYLYNFAYQIAEDDVPTVVSEDRTAIDGIASSATSLSSEAIPYSKLEAHAQVHTVADKYDIPKLKKLAKENFRHEARAYVKESRIYSFLKVVPYVYANCPPGEMGLRSCIVEAWNSNARVVNDCLGHQNFRCLAERFPDLGVDLFSSMVNEGPMTGGGGNPGSEGADPSSSLSLPDVSLDDRIRLSQRRRPYRGRG